MSWITISSTTKRSRRRRIENQPFPWLPRFGFAQQNREQNTKENTRSTKKSRGPVLFVPFVFFSVPPCLPFPRNAAGGPLLIRLFDEAQVRFERFPAQRVLRLRFFV